MKIILVIIMVLFCCNTFANPPIFTETHSNAIKLSKDLNMSILYIVSADWCSYCVKAEKTINNNLSVFDNIIILKIDFDSNPEFIEQYKIKKIPTIIYKNQKYIGIYKIEDFKKILKK